MKLNFDSRGNLKPYTRSTVSLKIFEEMFVGEFHKSHTRRLIFDEYLRYAENLRTILNKGFVQWINGSFISNKQNPGDMDFVTLIDFPTFDPHQIAIENEFTLWGAKRHYQNLDAYTVKIFPESHTEGVLTKSDLIYWANWFGRTKPNRSKTTYPKGFLEIQIP